MLPGPRIPYTAFMLLRTLALLSLTSAAAACAPAQQPFCDQIRTLIQDPTVAEAHWGISVTTLGGAPLCSINAAQLFRPASNAKLFTATAALALLGPNRTFTTSVLADSATLTELAPGHFAPDLNGDLWLTGGGDANLSTRPIPYAPPSAHAPDGPDPLALLADQVAASGIRHVTGGVMGADGLWPHEPPPDNWSVGDLVWDYGAPISALTVDDNRIKVTVSPGLTPGSPATAVFSPATPFYELHLSVTTTPAKTTSAVSFIREPGSKVLLVSGTVPLGNPDVEEIAISNPAEYAALAFRSMLEARGIQIDGAASFFHRGVPPSPAADASFEHQTTQPLPSVKAAPSPAPPCEFAACKTLATHASPTLLEDVTVTLKVSQNLHAELLLRHLGQSVAASGSTAQGIRVVRQFAVNAGLSPTDFALDDGSGLSTHDLVAPRALTQLLVYSARQPWFPGFKAALPIGGVDGSLIARFTGALKGHVFAKTGTLGESRALSGYLTAASGATLVFSVLVDNHLPTSTPEHPNPDRAVMDRIVETIAALN